MGHKITIKKIEKRSARTKTFSKRRKGLFKKAEELGILCNAQVAAIVISETNKFYHFANRSVDEIIERWNTQDKPIEAQEDTEEKAQEDMDGPIEAEEDMEEEAQEDMDGPIEAEEDMELLLDDNEEYKQLKCEIRPMDSKELDILSMEDLVLLEKWLQNSFSLVKAKQTEKQKEHNEKVRGDNEQTVEKIIGGLQQTMGSHFENEAGKQNVSDEQRTLLDPPNQKRASDDLGRLRLGMTEMRIIDHAIMETS